MISVSVPKEITEYREKIIFGLGKRQLICSAFAIVTAIALGALCTLVFHMSVETTGYAIIAAAMPIMGMGFIRKNNMPLEQYLVLLIRSKLGRNKLYYQTELTIRPAPLAQTTKKGVKQHHGTTSHISKRKRGCECQQFCADAPGRKIQR